MKTKQTTRLSGAFYAEALLLICVFTAVIMLVTRCFGAAQVSQAQARRLSAAVTLARSTAEGAAEARSPEELAELAVRGGSGSSLEQDLPGRRFAVVYNEDLLPEETGKYRLLVSWEEENGLIRYHIMVEDPGTGEEIYSLETASFPERREAP